MQAHFDKGSLFICIEARARQIDNKFIIVLLAPDGKLIAMYDNGFYESTFEPITDED